MRFFLMLALVVSTCTAKEATSYDAFIKCDDKGKRFAVVLPTGPHGSMKIKKLEHEHPQHYRIQKIDVSTFKGYVCMHLYRLLFYAEIKLDTLAVSPELKDVENFTWIAEVSEVSISSGGKHRVLKTYIWNLSDFDEFSELSNVNVGELEQILN